MQRFKKIVVGASVLAAVTAGVAYAASYASEIGSVPRRAADGDQTVSASWAMGGSSLNALSASFSQEGVFGASTVSSGAGATLGGRNAKPNTTTTIPLTSFKAVPTAKSESVYLQFTYSLEKEFTPTSISVDAWNVKNGGGRFALEIERDGNTQVLVEEQKPARTQEKAGDANESVDGYTFTYPVSDFAAGTGDITVKIYPFTSDGATNREIGFANVILTGTVPAAAPEEDNNYFCIPGELTFVLGDSHLSFSGAKTEQSETDGVMYPNVGYWSDGASATFNNVHVHKAGTYKVLLPTDNSYGDFNCTIEVKDAETGAVEASYSGNFLKNTSKWAKMEYELEGTVNEGLKNVVFTAVRPADVTRGYAGNFRAPEFVWTGEGEAGGDDPVVEVPAGWMSIPGALDVEKWNYNTDGHGRFGFENADKGVGYVKNNAVANVDFFNKEAGVYSMQWRWARSQGGDVRIVVKDLDTEKVEIDQMWTVADGTSDIMLQGLISTGKKNISLSMISNHDGWIGNYFTPVFTKVADTYAAVAAVTAADVAATAVEGYDYAFNLPLAYTAETVKFAVDYVGGTLEAKLGETVLAAEGNTYTIPAPACNEEAIVTLTLTPAEGAYCGQTAYKVRFYHIGDVVVDAVTVDGRAIDAELVKALNADAAAKFEGNVYTAVPAVKATFVDGTEATATVTVEGTVATAKFAGKAGEFAKEFTLAIDGVHLFERAESDLDAKLTFDDAGKGDDGNWSNGLYSLSNCNDGWGGKQFKMKTGVSHMLAIPGDMKVKQLILAQLYDNYADGKVKSITSEGADVWMPTASEYKKGGENAYNLVVNVENHKAGTPFEITFEGGNQTVAWFEFVYEAVAPEGAPVLVKTEATSTEHANHAVVTFSFDRAMADATITVNGTEVTAYGGTAALSFPVWDLAYSSTVEVVIPAGAAKDTYGNKTDKEYKHVLTVGTAAEPAAIAADRFIVVSNADEFRAAVAGLSATNAQAGCDWTVIYLLNGDYDLGGECTEVTKEDGKKEWQNTDALGNAPLLHINKMHNVALIGESTEGVLIHGMRCGISYPVFSTRYSTNVYMENFTLRNDLDFGRSDRRGVGVAHYGGNCDIMKNVVLQSIQDTQVTGERGYYLNCTIHGSVDYICGGGDHYYDHCTIIHEIAGGYVTAPSTSPTLKHGYVFQGCTIKGEGQYELGRPWQNEPRAFFLNTIMEALPQAHGWGKMGTLVTHFFEYNSMDAAGNVLDLSKRANSGTSVNSYSPILPAEYADYFTSRNVLGSKDSWEATDHTAECAAPVAKIDAAGNITWTAVEGAAGYVVFADGKFAGYTPDTKFVTSEAAAVVAMAEKAAEPEYTMAAVNANGARGLISKVAAGTSGVSDINAAGVVSVEYYNMQGVRVDASYTGFAVRVSTYADGRTVTEKVRL